MSAKKKISIVTFSSLAKNTIGPAHEAISIARLLHHEGRLGRIVCYDYDETCRLPQATFYTPPCRTFYKSTNRLFGLLARYWINSGRRIRENLFDFFVSLRCHHIDSDIVLFLKPSFKRTVIRLNKLGVTTIGRASVFHPEFNRRQVLKEEKRFNLDAQSSYSDAKRVRSLSCFYENIDALLVQSVLASSIYKNHGVPARKIIRLANTFGVDCRKYVPGPAKQAGRKFQVLHISHMSLIKGIGQLVTAWKRLNLKNADLLLGGTADQNIINLVKNIRPPATRMLGRISNTVPLFQEADVFVSPSISDVRPYTILEAMACGTPVISSDMCGGSELISHGVDGFVYPYDSVDKLQELLVWCIENRNELIEMGKKARRKAILHQSDHSASKILMGIDRWIGEHGEIA